jgi:hypothetical protein
MLAAWHGSWPAAAAAGEYYCTFGMQRLIFSAKYRLLVRGGCSLFYKINPSHERLRHSVPLKADRFATPRTLCRPATGGMRASGQRRESQRGSSTALTG